MEEALDNIKIFKHLVCFMNQYIKDFNEKSLFWVEGKYLKT